MANPFVMLTYANLPLRKKSFGCCFLLPPAERVIGLPLFFRSKNGAHDNDRQLIGMENKNAVAMYRRFHQDFRVCANGY